jgi:hypothetical protein
MTSDDKVDTTDPQMTLDVARNTLDDETHARMDKEVIEAAGTLVGAVLDRADEDSDSFAQASYFLLATIVSTSELLLHTTYGKSQNANGLLAEHPNLATKLREAWENKTFREIRNLREIVPCR